MERQTGTGILCLYTPLHVKTIQTVYINSLSARATEIKCV